MKNKLERLSDGQDVVLNGERWSCIGSGGRRGSSDVITITRTEGKEVYVISYYPQADRMLAGKKLSIREYREHQQYLKINGAAAFAA